ncbi:hypothetical protein [Pseudogemmobacter sonorensis]|uniref:hypothetical protein n=1 Tax=Pseudogemmobacter sonorensis TaxID=2989681 RepID=UPI003675AB38
MIGLTLSERLRVAAALHPDGVTIRLDRDTALALVKIIEREERTQRMLIGLMADAEAYRERGDRAMDEALWSCLIIAGSVVSFTWLIAGWV